MQATIKALFAQHSESNKQASGSVLARPSFGLDLNVAPVPPTPRTTGQEVRTVVSSLEDAPPLATSARVEGSASSPALSTSAGVRAVNGVASLSHPKKRAKDFDYYLDPQELLEISCCALNANTRLIEAEFQALVRPTEHPNLTDFCIELTGITQQQCVPL